MVPAERDSLHILSPFSAECSDTWKEVSGGILIFSSLCVSFFKPSCIYLDLLTLHRSFLPMYSSTCSPSSASFLFLSDFVWIYISFQTMVRFIRGFKIILPLDILIFLISMLITLFLLDKKPYSPTLCAAAVLITVVTLSPSTQQFQH